MGIEKDKQDDKEKFRRLFSHYLGDYFPGISESLLKPMEVDEIRLKEFVTCTYHISKNIITDINNYLEARRNSYKEWKRSFRAAPFLPWNIWNKYEEFDLPYLLIREIGRIIVLFEEDNYYITVDPDRKMNSKYNKTKGCMSPEVEIGQESRTCGNPSNNNNNTKSDENIYSNITAEFNLANAENNMNKGVSNSELQISEVGQNNKFDLGYIEIRPIIQEEDKDELVDKITALSNFIFAAIEKDFHQSEWTKNNESKESGELKTSSLLGRILKELDNYSYFIRNMKYSKAISLWEKFDALVSIGEKTVREIYDFLLRAAHFDDSAPIKVNFNVSNILTGHSLEDNIINTRFFAIIRHSIDKDIIAAAEGGSNIQKGHFRDGNLKLLNEVNVFDLQTYKTENVELNKILGYKDLITAEIGRNESLGIEKQRLDDLREKLGNKRLLDVVTKINPGISSFFLRESGGSLDSMLNVLYLLKAYALILRQVSLLRDRAKTYGNFMGYEYFTIIKYAAEAYSKVYAGITCHLNTIIKNMQDYHSNILRKNGCLPGWTGSFLELKGECETILSYLNRQSYLLYEAAEFAERVDDKYIKSSINTAREALNEAKAALNSLAEIGIIAEQPIGQLNPKQLIKITNDDSMHACDINNSTPDTNTLNSQLIEINGKETAKRDL